METVLIILFAIVICFTVAAFGYMLYDWRMHALDFKVQMKVGGKKKFLKASAVIGLTLFLDPIGIGANGPTAAGLKFFKITRDKQIPGTLQTFCIIYTTMATLWMIKEVPVDISNLIGVIVAAGIGSAVGEKFFSKLELSKLRLCIGVGLVVVACILLLKTAGILPSPADAGGTGVDGWKFAVLLVVSFVFGALMTIGVGIYAPMMCTVALLGMNYAAAYPLMMGSCALLVPIASILFIREGFHSPTPLYDRKASVVGNTVGVVTGALGTITILSLINGLDVTLLNYFVVCIVIILAALMIYQYLRKSNDIVADDEDVEFERLKAEYVAAHPDAKNLA